MSVLTALPYSSKMGIVKCPMLISTAGININKYSLGPVEEFSGTSIAIENSDKCVALLLGIKSLERT